MATHIGLKLADGSFYPVMEETPSASQTLELTTVRDDQNSVQINLFKKDDYADTLEYIGSLIVEDIAVKPTGEPTIELALNLDEEKNLSAQAIDLDTGSRQALTVAFKTLASSDLYSSPDFDLSSNDDFELADPLPEFGSLQSSFDSNFSSDYAETPVRAEQTDESTATDESVLHVTNTETSELYEEKKSGLPLWLLIVLILLGLAILVLGVLLLTKNLSRGSSSEAVVLEAPREPAKPKETKITTPPKPAEPAAKKEEKVETQEAVTTQVETQDVKKETPVEKTEAPVEKPETKRQADTTAGNNAVTYRLKWGDTLWDLSETFYKNPWSYMRIARHNHIENPDLIIAGTDIEIPAR